MVLAFPTYLDSSSRESGISPTELWRIFFASRTHIVPICIPYWGVSYILSIVYPMGVLPLMAEPDPLSAPHVSHAGMHVHTGERGKQAEDAGGAGHRAAGAGLQCVVEVERRWTRG